MNIYHDICFSFSILQADIFRFRSRRKTADAMRLPLQLIYIYFTLYIVIVAKIKSIYLSIKVNLVPEHAFSFLCLILRNDPPIITGQYHYIDQTPQTRQKLALFVVWGWGNNVIYNDLNIQHIYFCFRFLDFAIKLLQTRVT